VGFKSEQLGGAHFLYCDGSVGSLIETIARPTYAALGSKTGGEAVSADAY
jgi:prepilin-type processing-associated H-X9-DG protein